MGKRHQGAAPGEGEAAPGLGAASKEVEVLHQQGEAQGEEERGEDGVAATRWREREKWGVLGLGAPPPFGPLMGRPTLMGCVGMAAQGPVPPQTN